MKKKDIRLIIGIICAPIKAVARAIRHESTQHLLMSRARERKWQSDWERMHHMASITNTAYTKSPLYMHLGEL
jgi:hypothetical protein